MASPDWSDIYTPQELAAALRLHAAKLAKRFGVYDVAGDLTLAADALEELSDTAKVTVDYRRNA